MNKGKRRVRRLALYLCSIGIHPNAAGTQSQYDQLEQQQRKLARRTGRQLIVEFGSIAKALAIASHAVREALPANSISVLPRIRSRQEQFLDNLSRWSPLTPPCPSCRMGNGFHAPISDLPALTPERRGSDRMRTNVLSGFFAAR